MKNCDYTIGLEVRWIPRCWPHASLLHEKNFHNNVVERDARGEVDHGRRLAKHKHNWHGPQEELHKFVVKRDASGNVGHGRHPCKRVVPLRVTACHPLRTWTLSNVSAETCTSDLAPRGALCVPRPTQTSRTWKRWLAAAVRFNRVVYSVSSRCLARSANSGSSVRQRLELSRMRLINVQIELHLVNASAGS